MSQTPARQKSPERDKRPYLRAQDRRQQLLGVAAGIAGKDGLDRLTMAGLASQAGVSRQLVYEHFADLPDLVAALLIDRFAAVDAKIAAALALNDKPGVETALFAVRQALSLGSEERGILRALLTRTSPRDHELADLAATLRNRVIDRWTEIIGSRTDPATRALVWAIVNAIFAIGDLIDTKTISIDQLTRLITAAYATPSIDPTAR